MVNDIDALLERVKAATGPDRNLDAMLHHWALSGVGTGYYADSPSYTASIDAALALTERVLPGREWLKKSPKVISVYRPLTEQEDAAKVWAKHYDGTGATIPLAILAAALTALINRGAEQ